MQFRPIFINVYSFVLACLMFSSPTQASPETKGYFCNNCVDFESARQQALQYAAPIQCNNQGILIDPNEPLVCWAEDRRIILGNHFTGQVFAFLVIRGDERPWETTAEPVALSAIETQVYETILDFRVDWENTLAEGMVMEPEPTQGIQNESDEGSSVCPTGTALDFVIGEGGQAAIEDMITADINANIEEYRNARTWHSDFDVGLTVSGTSGSIQFPKSDNENPVYAVVFAQSEVPTQNLNDRLIYEVDLLGVGPDAEPILGIEFLPGVSRAAGARLDLLLSGNVPITNQCVIDKLLRFGNETGNEIRRRSAALDPSDSFGSRDLSDDGSTGESSRSKHRFD